MLEGKIWTSITLSPRAGTSVFKSYKILAVGPFQNIACEEELLLDHGNSSDFVYQ